MDGQIDARRGKKGVNIALPPNDTSRTVVVWQDLNLSANLMDGWMDGMDGWIDG